MLSDEMDIFSVDLNIINLDDANFCEDDAKTIFHASVVARHNKLKQIQNIQKINQQRVNTCSMVSNNMIGLVHGRGWEKIIV